MEEFGFTHLSAGDLLRAERDTGSEVAELINNYIREGLIVPKEITIGLLKTAMEKSANSAGYLIDGFPRALDQWTAFEDTVVPAKYGLYFVCSEEELERRLLERGKTSGRVDDNIESIKKRFKTFQDTSLPVIEGLREQGRLQEVDSSLPVDEVYASVRDFFTTQGQDAE